MLAISSCSYTEQLLDSNVSSEHKVTPHTFVVTNVGRIADYKEIASEIIKPQYWRPKRMLVLHPIPQNILDRSIIGMYGLDGIFINDTDSDQCHIYYPIERNQKRFVFTSHAMLGHEAMHCFIGYFHGSSKSRKSVVPLSNKQREAINDNLHQNGFDLISKPITIWLHQVPPDDRLLHNTTKSYVGDSTVEEYMLIIQAFGVVFYNNGVCHIFSPPPLTYMDDSMEMLGELIEQCQEGKIGNRNALELDAALSIFDKDAILTTD
jgi:hypothetical protein